MKKMSTLIILGLAIVVGSYAWAVEHSHEGHSHEHSKWFDATACDICKPWAENPALMMATKWETHTINNGMIMVSNVDKEHLEAFNDCCKEMEATIKKISEGVQPKELCGFCQAMGGLMQAGAKLEEVRTATGKITLVTADNPEAVKMIHAVAKRAQEETKKLAAMMAK